MPLGRGKKRKRKGNPAADGYDLHSLIKAEVSRVRSGDVFGSEEVMGKYLDLTGPYHEALAMIGAFSAASSVHLSAADNKEGEEKKEDGDVGEVGARQRLQYADFLALLLRGLSEAPPSESAKLRDRRKYVRFLTRTFAYLSDFLRRTAPLLDADAEVVRPALAEFDAEWAETGGAPGWESREAERAMVVGAAGAIEAKGDAVALSSPVSEIDLSEYGTAEELREKVGGDALKAELARIGLKCGGTPLDRAKRLLLTKDTPLDQLPKKVFAKRGGKGPADPKAGPLKTSPDALMADDVATATADAKTALPFGMGGYRRIDVARLEFAASALLDQLRPALDATARRAERRLTQTSNERDRELEEEINGANDLTDKKKRRGEGGDDIDAAGGLDTDSDDDDDEAPIYNPKGVPLGWDGKPIPYWLFKLHGLNHFYPCEICGNESYRGRRNFEKHFTESKHAYGMRCLGIPNTKHFHGVIKIEDAQRLWDKLKDEIDRDIYVAEKEEEYEDSHGNVLNRKTYEDLARQGLL